jgi:hypothetical protein
MSGKNFRRNRPGKQAGILFVFMLVLLLVVEKQPGKSRTKDE